MISTGWRPRRISLVTTRPASLIGCMPTRRASPTARLLACLGDVAEGAALLDEAMVSIEANELSPMATGDAYCTVIDACSELFDFGRCRAWTESFGRWCDTQQELVLYRGHCFLH